MPEDKRPKILIVDDEEKDLRLMGAILTNYGYTFEKAKSGFEALEKAKTFLPDLILLDIMMPEMDGYEVCRRLKEEPSTRHITVVMVTALNRPEDMARGFESGADEFLTKPVNRFELIARMRNLLKIKYLSEKLTAQNGSFSKLTIPIEGGKKVLIVEDEEKTSKLMCKIFDAEGYEVKVAYTAGDAWKELIKEKPDIILLDLLLSDMYGLDFLKMLRNMDADIPVIVITILDDLNTKISGIEIGADEYLIKPVNREELILRVKALLKRAEMQKWLKASQTAAFKKAITDHLTGLYNREYLDEYLGKEIQKAVRYRMPLSIVMIDIDYFKRINDSYGHLTGDMILKQLSEIMEKNVRTTDLVFRYGGEEFIIIMPDTDEKSVFSVVERLRLTVKGNNFRTHNGSEINLTISVGVYTFKGGDEKLEQIISKADKALYEAKASGRDKVVMARIEMGDGIELA